MQPVSNREELQRQGKYFWSEAQLMHIISIVFLLQVANERGSCLTEAPAVYHCRRPGRRGQLGHHHCPPIHKEWGTKYCSQVKMDLSLKWCMKTHACSHEDRNLPPILMKLLQGTNGDEKKELHAMPSWLNFLPGPGLAAHKYQHCLATTCFQGWNALCGVCDRSWPRR